MEKAIWVCGEALIDLIPEVDAQTKSKKVVVGGGPANTAVALARLGHNAVFIGGISTSDIYGNIIKTNLEENKVDLSLAHFVAKPTCTADVTLNENGGATYVFTIEGTATFDYRKDWLPTISESAPALLHIGTLVTVIEPGATTLFDWATQVSEQAPVLLDPNIRPTVIPDRAKYQLLIERWFEIATVIKFSDDDLSWLYEGYSLEEIINGLLKHECKVVVITRGANGIAAYYRKQVSDIAINLNKSANNEVSIKETAGSENSGNESSTNETSSIKNVKGDNNSGISDIEAVNMDFNLICVEVPGVKVEVVDTIGAGDTVGAVLAQSLYKNEWDLITNPNFDESEVNSAIKNTLQAAAVAAAITCSREGANPPTNAEIKQMLSKM